MQNDLLNMKQSLEIEIASCNDLASLQKIKVKALGKKGVITEQLKQLSNLSPDERPIIGAKINQIKKSIDSLIKSKQITLQEQSDIRVKNSSRLDVTLDGITKRYGSLHPVTMAQNLLLELFSNLGFSFVEGPEIENDYYNFTALNIPEHHPARAMHDTFYFPGGELLRSHTSPVQIRYMREAKSFPIKIVSFGKVYRCDFDVTHTPMFHQLEGALIAERVNFSHLKKFINNLLVEFFGYSIKTRFRPSYFPFTEPSAEVDIQCVKCNGNGCRICSDTGWLEVLGCGLMHPKVLQNGNIDTDKYSGFAFGLGVDRLAMLKFDIDDLRLMFEGSLEFLQQFS